MKTEVIKSDRLYFSNISQSNRAELLSHLNHPDMLYCRYLPWEFDRLLLDEEDIQKLIEHWSSSKSSQAFGIFEISNNNFIGHVEYDFGWDTNSMMLRMAIYPDFRRKGYGKESLSLILNYMFDNTVVHNINTYVDDWNEVGRHFAESVFHYAGTMRRTSIKNGKYVNSISYDILRPEWRNV